MGKFDSLIEIVSIAIKFVSELFDLHDGDEDEVKKHITNLRLEVADRRAKRDKELADKHGR